MRSPIVFIDSNIYLKLFESHDSKYLDTIDFLISIKDTLFIPQRIVFEVERRKLALFDEYMTKVDRQEREEQRDTLPLPIPSHLSQGNGPDSPSRWNEERTEIRRSAKRLCERLPRLRLELARLVAESQDQASVRLSRLFQNASEPTERQEEKAAARASHGDPPGKYDNPIGDQICWIQLVDRWKQNPELDLWLVTSDSDYATTIGTEVILNPMLYNEIQRELPTRGGKVVIIRSLATLVKQYKEDINNNLAPSLDASTLNRMIEEEALIQSSGTSTPFGGSAVFLPAGTSLQSTPYGSMAYLPFTSQSYTLLYCSKCQRSYPYYWGVGGAQACPYCST